MGGAAFTAVRFAEATRGTTSPPSAMAGAVRCTPNGIARTGAGGGGAGSSVEALSPAPVETTLGAVVFFSSVFVSSTLFTVGVWSARSPPSVLKSGKRAFSCLFSSTINASRGKFAAAPFFLGIPGIKT